MCEVLWIVNLQILAYCTSTLIPFIVEPFLTKVTVCHCELTVRMGQILHSDLSSLPLRLLRETLATRLGSKCMYVNALPTFFSYFIFFYAGKGGDADLTATTRELCVLLHVHVLDYTHTAPGIGY